MIQVYGSSDSNTVQAVTEYQRIQTLRVFKHCGTRISSWSSHSGRAHSWWRNWRAREHYSDGGAESTISWRIARWRMYHNSGEYWRGMASTLTKRSGSGDFLSRPVFCKWLIENSDLSFNILFTDEAHFTTVHTILIRIPTLPLKLWTFLCERTCVKRKCYSMGRFANSHTGCCSRNQREQTSAAIS